VQSYRNIGGAWWTWVTDSLCTHSAFGHLVFVEQKVDKPQFACPHWQWGAGSKPMTDLVNAEKGILNYHKIMGFGWGDEWGQRFLMTPHWFTAVLLGAIGGLPWLSWRFSLLVVTGDLVSSGIAIGQLNETGEITLGLWGVIIDRVAVGSNPTYRVRDSAE
jgi:hypothetical protein